MLCVGTERRKRERVFFLKERKKKKAEEGNVGDTETWKTMTRKVEIEIEIDQGKRREWEGERRKNKYNKGMPRVLSAKLTSIFLPLLLSHTGAIVWQDPPEAVRAFKQYLCSPS